MKPIFSVRVADGDAVSIIDTRFATIDSGWASACTAIEVRNCSSWNGNTGYTASTLWITTGSPACDAAAYTGS